MQNFTIADLMGQDPKALEKQFAGQSPEQMAELAEKMLGGFIYPFAGQPESLLKMFTAALEKMGNASDCGYLIKLKNGVPTIEVIQGGRVVRDYKLENPVKGFILWLIKEFGDTSTIPA